MDPTKLLQARKPLKRALMALCCGIATSLPAAAIHAAERPDESECPAGAPDQDGDSICDAAEARYGTDPKLADTDGDALSDAAELFGIMVDGVTDDNTPQLLDLPALGASPLHKDVFLEIDYYPGRRPRDSGMQLVQAAFAEAPVSNPDGSNGINLHYDIDSEISKADADATPNIGGPAGDLMVCDTDACPALYSVEAYKAFEPIKVKYVNHLRHSVYHYALCATEMRIGGTRYGGISFDIGAHDFVVTQTGPLFEELWEAGTIMHELGHNLGLRHGGTDHVNHKPNYLSVMNYNYQGGLLRSDGRTVDGKGRPTALDYSRHTVDALSELAVDEVSAMAPGDGTTEADLMKYSIVLNGSRDVLTGNASANLDFNGNHSIESGPYAWDLDGDRAASRVFPATQNDWKVLKLDARGTIGDRPPWDLPVAGEAQSDDTPSSSGPCGLVQE